MLDWRKQLFHCTILQPNKKEKKKCPFFSFCYALRLLRDRLVCPFSFFSFTLFITYREEEGLQASLLLDPVSASPSFLPYFFNEEKKRQWTSFHHHDEIVIAAGSFECQSRYGVTGK
jgi:hypothetical protein